MGNENKSGTAVKSCGRECPGLAISENGNGTPEAVADVLLPFAMEEIKPSAVYDTVAAGRVLHRSPRWVAKMCAAGRIKAVKNNGWRVFGSALVAFLRGE